MSHTIVFIVGVPDFEWRQRQKARRVDIGSLDSWTPCSVAQSPRATVKRPHRLPKDELQNT